MIDRRSLRAVLLAVTAAATIGLVSVVRGSTPPGPTSGASSPDSSAGTPTVISKPATTQPATVREDSPQTQPGEGTGEWSQPVNGLVGRIVLVRDQVLNGTPIISTRLDLRNVSDAAMPLRLPADRKLTFRVVDAAARELPRAMGVYDGLMPYPEDLLLPRGAELSVNLTHSGLGILGDQVALIDLGVEDNWIIPRDGKGYFLQVALEVPQAIGSGESATRTWHGRLELPAARIPLRGEPMDPTTIAQRIDELGRAMIARPGEAGGTARPHSRPSSGPTMSAERARRALSLIDDKRVIPWYVKAIQTNSYELKFAALDRLSRFNTDDALAGLKIGMATRGSDIGNCTTQETAEGLAENIRVAAAGALARSPHPQAKSLLLAMWSDPSKGVRLSVLHGLGAMNDQESLDLLKRMSADADPDVRNEAIRLLQAR